jgi:hypothetical protein
MDDGNYTYVLEAAEDGETHTFEYKAGVYTADGIEQTDPLVQCLMDATLDLLLANQEMVTEIDRHEMEICPSCAPHVHPGSGRSH